MIDDERWNAAAFGALAPLAREAEKYGPMISSVVGVEFRTAPLPVRQCALITIGIATVHRTPIGEDPDDYVGGRFHRAAPEPEYTELQRRRYPPTGDRDLWVKYGPAGPPPEVST